MSHQKINKIIGKFQEIERLLGELKLDIVDLQEDNVGKANKTQEDKIQTKKVIKKETTKTTKKKVSLGVVDSTGSTIHVGDEVSYQATPSTAAGTGLADSVTRGTDPFLRIKPIHLKTEDKTYTKYSLVQRKPYNVDLII